MAKCKHEGDWSIPKDRVCFYEPVSIFCKSEKFKGCANKGISYLVRPMLKIIKSLQLCFAVMLQRQQQQKTHTHARTQSQIGYTLLYLTLTEICPSKKTVDLVAPVPGRSAQHDNAFISSSHKRTFIALEAARWLASRTGASQSSVDNFN